MKPPSSSVSQANLPVSPTLFVLAGPNGAGKSSAYEQLEQYRFVTRPFLNPDNIAHRRTGQDAETCRCWLRLQVSASVDAEDAATPQVDELLPVDVTYECRHRA